MPEANLTCLRATCSGEFEYVGDRPGEELYRCEECGEELSQRAAERVADGDGYAADLAKVLLNGGPQ